MAYKTPGTGYVNLSRILDLNREDAQKMGDKVAGTFGAEANAARGAVDSAYGDWKNQATYEGGAGKSYDDFMGGKPELQTGLANAQANLKNLGTNTGQSAYMRKQYGTNTGGSRLDAFLLGGAGGDQFNNLSKTYSGLANVLSGTKTQAGQYQAGLDKEHANAMDEASRAANEAIYQERQKGYQDYVDRNNQNPNQDNWQETQDARERQRRANRRMP